METKDKQWFLVTRTLLDPMVDDGVYNPITKTFSLFASLSEACRVLPSLCIANEKEYGIKTGLELADRISMTNHWGKRHEVLVDIEEGSIRIPELWDIQLQVACLQIDGSCNKQMAKYLTRKIATTVNDLQTKK